MNLEYPQSNCELAKMGLCNLDSWCMCEAVEMIQANIEEMQEDIPDNLVLDASGNKL